MAVTEFLTTAFLSIFEFNLDTIRAASSEFSDLIGRGGFCSVYKVMRCWSRGEAIDVIYEVMREQEREDSVREILRYVHIALLCIDVNPETRPSLDKVLHWFSCLSTPLPEPTFGLFEVETNRSLSPSLSPGYSSDMSPTSSRYGD